VIILLLLKEMEWISKVGNVYTRYTWVEVECS
jgi:hypothetical protein